MHYHCWQNSGEKEREEGLIMLARNWLTCGLSITERFTFQSQERLKRNPHRVAFYLSNQPKYGSASRETRELR